eukprot:7112547-Pyramimonas_sp.AAC.1
MTGAAILAPVHRAPILANALSGAQIRPQSAPSGEPSPRGWQGLQGRGPVPPLGFEATPAHGIKPETGTM